MRCFLAYQSLSFIALGTIILASCGGQEGAADSSRRIINPGAEGNAAGSSLPTCEAYTKSIDTDGDGISDYDEFVGFTPAGSTEVFRTDPQLADTDGDGKSDGEELNASKNGQALGIKKVDGLSTADVLKNPVLLHPLHRDFIILIHSQGGENSSRIYNAANKNGWNIYSGLGSADAGKEKTRFLRQSTENELQLINLSTESVDRAKVAPDWLPNKCFSNPNDLVCTCWQGDPNVNNEVGCTNASGVRLTNNARDQNVDYNGIVGANNTFRNSLIGRFNMSTDRYSTASPTAFRLGSVGDQGASAGQSPTGGMTVEYLGNFKWKIPLSTSQDTQHLMLRNQDSHDGTSNNSGFVAMIARFITSDMTYLNKYAPFSSDADKAAKLATFYQSTIYKDKCTP